MPVFGVTVAIVQDGKILLVKREDFPAWCLPGGAVDNGETLAQTAIREAEEETGLKVKLLHQVGVYSRPNWRSCGAHEILFSAHQVGGELLYNTAETVDIGYFDAHALPDTLFWWHRQQIMDALSSRKGVAWALDVAWHLGDQTREMVQAEIAAGRILEQDLYHQFCDYPQPGKEICEAGGEAA